MWGLALLEVESRGRFGLVLRTLSGYSAELHPAVWGINMGEKMKMKNKASFSFSPGCKAVGHAEEPSSHEL